MSLLASIGGVGRPVPAAPHVYNSFAAVPLPQVQTTSVPMQQVALSAGTEMFSLYRVAPTAPGPPVLGNPLSTTVLGAQLARQFPPLVPTIGGALGSSGSTQPYTVRGRPTRSQSQSLAQVQQASSMPASSMPASTVPLSSLQGYTYDPHFAAGSQFAQTNGDGGGGGSGDGTTPIVSPKMDSGGDAGSGSGNPNESADGLPGSSSGPVVVPGDGSSSGSGPSSGPGSSPGPGSSSGPVVVPGDGDGSAQGSWPGPSPGSWMPPPSQQAPWLNPYLNPYVDNPYANGARPRVGPLPMMGFDPEPAVPLPVAFSRAYGYPYGGPLGYPYGPIGLYEAGLLPVPGPLPVTTIGQTQFIDGITNGIAYAARPMGGWTSSTIRDATPVGSGLGVPPPCIGGGCGSRRGGLYGFGGGCASCRGGLF